MDATAQTILPKLLTLAALIAVTIEYVEIIKRRSARHHREPEVTRSDSQGLGRGARSSMSFRRSNAVADIGWAAIGLIALLIARIVRAWRATAAWTFARKEQIESGERRLR